MKLPIPLTCLLISVRVFASVPDVIPDYVNQSLHGPAAAFRVQKVTERPKGTWGPVIIEAQVRETYSSHFEISKGESCTIQWMMQGNAPTTLKSGDEIIAFGRLEAKVFRVNADGLYRWTPENHEKVVKSPEYVPPTDVALRRPAKTSSGLDVVQYTLGPELISPLGYSLRWPNNYTGVRHELQGGIESVVAYPDNAGLEPTDAADPAMFKKFKIVSLKVFPKAIINKTASEYLSDVSGSLKKSGRKFTSKFLKSPVGEAVIIRESDPNSVTLMTVGKNNYYEFVASADHLPLQTMLRSLKEHTPDPKWTTKKEDIANFIGKLDELEHSGREKRTGLKTRKPQRQADGFVGRYGTFIPCGPEWEAYSRWAADDPTIEIIHLFKKGTPAGALNDVARHAEFGIVTLEVIPRLDKTVDNLKYMRNEYAQLLRDQGVKFTQEEITSPLPGVAFYIRSPYKLDRILLQSPTIAYKFLSGAERDLLFAFMRGLKTQ